MKQYVATSIFTGGVGDGYHGSSGYHGHDDDDQMVMVIIVMIMVIITIVINDLS